MDIPIVVGIVISSLGLAIAITGFVCWLLVLIKIFRENPGLGVLGLFVSPFVFIFGWVRVKAYNTLRVMVIWTIVAVLSGLLMPALLLPAIASARGRAQGVRVANNGRQIYLTAYEQAMEAEALDQPSTWPMTSGPDAVSTSTDYFRKLMASGASLFTPRFFGAPSLPQPTGMEASSLLAAHNAWCVVADINMGSAPSGTPFLFTRNLEISADGDQVTMRLSDAKPFGRKMAVVITSDGSTRILHAEYLQDYAQGLDPAQLKKILRP